jgi:hypothetical protein
MTSKLLVGGLAVAVAFLLVTNPVVVDAAGQITGAQVKNSSLKGKDVKDDSLTGKDVAESTLSTVPSATNATNATNAGTAATLNGQPPSAYLNSVIRVPVAATASSTGFIKTLPTVANGTYLVTINVNANISVGGGLFCSLYPSSLAGDALMASFGSNYGGNGLSSINAAKVVTVSGPLALFCASSGGPFTTPISSYNPSEITFTKIDTVTTTAPVARGSEGGPVSGPAPRP